MGAKYPATPAVGSSVDSHTQVLQVIVEKVGIYERVTPDILASFVRVSDLVDLNILAVRNGRLVLGTAFDS